MRWPPKPDIYLQKPAKSKNRAMIPKSPPAIGCLILPLTCLLTVVCSQSGLAQDHIEWLFDLEQAKQVASEQDKLVMIHFSAAWCEPCKELDRFVFVNPMAIRAISSQVVPVKIDVDVHSTIAGQYDVSSVPWDVLITPAGHIVAEQSSPRSSDGYIQLIADAGSRARNLTDDMAHRAETMRKANRLEKQQRAEAQAGYETSGSFTAPSRPPASVSSAAEFRSGGVPAPASFASRHPGLAEDSPNESMPAATGNQPVSGGGSFSTSPENTWNMNETTGKAAESFAATKVSPQMGAGLPNAIREPNQFGDGHFSNSGERFSSAAGNVTRGGGSFSASPQSSPVAWSKTRGSAAVDSSPAGLPGQSISNRHFTPAAADDPASPVRITNSFMSGNAGDPVALQETPANDRGAGMLSPQAGTVPSGPAGPMDVAQSGPKAVDSSGASDLPPVGLDGYCGVTLIEDQRWVRGSREFGCIHRGKLYLFASRDHLERFKMAPDMFSPLLAGADPVTWYSSGQLTDGARKHGVFYGDEGEPTVIVLFESQENLQKFEADPSRYLQSVRQAMLQADKDSTLR